ncbi:MAG: hypothetical protein HKP61_09285, partial [Dactylosporangium sp.]|nr:hypothetical protein [Dactylosporangium sp.]NNJ61125.1 hypothetical protein [Dactylosporangium sp.]
AVLTTTGEFRALTAPDHFERNGGNGDGAPRALGKPPAAARRPGAKRTGIPEEARTWITECLRRNETPTGPDIGRRFRVDPSTGRRWLRQIRESR